MILHEYMTTSEVCAYLRLRERTIYDLVSRQAIPCSRVTGKLLFPRHLIDRWVEANIELRDGGLTSPPPIVAGSSDPLLDWALRESGSGLATLFEGSEAGLRRLAANEAIAVGLHLYEPDTEKYNVQAVRALAGVADLVLIRWSGRQQGLILPAGNPLGIAGLADLARHGARLVPRQPGSGSQVLLEALLAREGLSIGALTTLDRPALTETDVAAAIADGRADCGLGIGAAARRFGLAFVPLKEERFDLALRRRSYFEPSLQALWALARTPGFAAQAEQLGGYDTAATGRVELNS